MTEMATIAQSDETGDAAVATATFSYCCECGTYDAHTHVCTCCGFDFRGDPVEVGE